METDQQIAETFLNSIKDDIIANHIRIGQKASGETISKLRVKTDIFGGQLFAPFYFGSLVTGRGATTGGGTGGGGKTLREKIYDWLAFAKYGLAVGDDKERTSLSWAIATIIHKRGTYLFRSGKNSGLLSDIITVQRLKSLSGKFATNKAIQFKSDIVKSFRRK